MTHQWGYMPVIDPQTGRPIYISESGHYQLGNVEAWQQQMEAPTMRGHQSQHWPIPQAGLEPVHSVASSQTMSPHVQKIIYTLDQPRPAPSPPSPPAPKYGRDVFFDIVLSFLALTIPLLALTGVLLYLVFAFRLDPNPPHAIDFQNSYNTTLGTDTAYYINFHSNVILAVSGWYGNVVPLLPTVVMGLLLYYVSATIKNNSDSGNANELPTPYQLSLLVGFSQASIGSIWHWLKYIFTKRRENAVFVIGLTFCVLIFSLLLGLVSQFKLDLSFSN
jgi:hypothetical protein